MAIIEVTTLADVVNASDGVTSLREALAQAKAAAGADTITFTTAPGSVFVNAALGNLTIDSDVTINGDVAGVGGTRDIVIDGGDATRLFYVGGSTGGELINASLQN